MSRLFLTPISGSSASFTGILNATDTASINNLTVYGTSNFVNGSIPVFDLTASAITIGSTAIGLGLSSTTIAGLTSVSATRINAASHVGIGSTTASFYGDGSGLTGITGGGVTQIVAGTNVTISPAGGTGAVTINASGGSGSPDSDQNILAVAIFS